VWSIVERVRYLRLKSEPLAKRLPADREPTETVREQAVREAVRAIITQRKRADLALASSILPIVMAIFLAVLQGKGRDT
jgi:hypothetical protein